LRAADFNHGQIATTAMQLNLRRLLPHDLPEFRSWFGDAELARRLAYPTDEWHAAVSRGGQQCWIAVDNSHGMVAVTQVERDGDVGYIAIAVKPDLRQRGFGTAALTAFTAGPGREYAALDGRIEPNNIASLACARKCGFCILDALDDDGLFPARWANPAKQANSS
jgi:RimJ/RimL family protein N-acetyltransferase